MQNHLFNQALLKKYSTEFKLNPHKHDLLKEYINKVEAGDLKSETKNYLYFYDVILKDILGYKREDVLFDEKGDEGAGRSEFVLKSDDKKFMVIEIKGQGIDLDKRQSGRSDNKSPVEQAFGYAINTGDVNWIMVSNYDEFRLYNYYEKNKYISFNIGELLNKETFAYFMLSFSRGSHIESDNITRVSEDTLIVDRKLASEFYKLYNETRLMLIKELEAESGLERLDAIHYAQLILNRYMFVCFAEDTKLLPSQISTNTIATPIQKGNLRHGSIWQRLNELCLDINEGNEFKKINEYNGGLFREDLCFIKIRDLVEDQNFFNDVYQDYDFTEYEKDINHLLGTAKDRINPIYRNMLTISSFDFSTELDVNILGHIFENSIGDIEELKEDSKGRRKKEGIFYTPDYITDYICRNTIIPYLSKSGKSNTITDLMVEYWGSSIEELDHKVKNIKVVDPACGSGAFLNKASDILLEIHQIIHETRYKDKQNTLKPYFDNIGQRREILLNNIYGVDLNEESVDTTKLSLFLKVCRKGLKLPNLDKNIKCGNSLIDDPEFTEKPFNWEKQFPEIFNEGGFDVVIGNPPWGADFDEPTKKYLRNKYHKLEYQINSYVVFMERTNYLLKNKGILGIIIPPTWLYMHYFKNMRNFLISKNTFIEAIYLKYHVFEDVTSESSIICYRKSPPSDSHEILNKIVKNEDEFHFKPLSRIKQTLWIENFIDGFLFEDQIKLFKKFNKNSEVLGSLADLTTGIKPYQTNKGTPPQTREDVKNKIYSATEQINEMFKPYLVGKNITRYNINYPNDQWLKYGSWIAEVRQTFDFSKVKIVIRRTGDRIFASIDEKGYLDLNSTHNLIMKGESNFDLKYILCILNSSLINYIYSNLVPDDGRVFSEIKIVNLEKLPIYYASQEEQLYLIEKADKIIQINLNLQEEVNSFKHWIIKEFKVERLSQKLEKYYELSEDEFFDELRKKKVNTKSRKNRESLEREFTESLAIIRPLLKEIEQTDNEIDQMVYELYGLNEDEIKIIENTLNSCGGF